MTSNQPYLLRAFYDWIVDNGLTPYVVVDANKDGVDVPREFVQNGQIVLNISPSACVSLHLDLEILSFQARFGGTPRFISMPCNAISAIYARENGAGTVFVAEGESATTDESQGTADTKLESVDSASEQTPEQSDTKPPRPSGKPTLKVIK
ncbi:ClpXP protease specificity-enhancing factor [Alteromonas sediminis]|uniref:ClpXP protease specificity-enhancing factor n=2 Tax=Alteromonas sediminis TaxID=2259342 RepID=A0A3N5Y563_9ALTE|nr:ClpXP protease specificity-enhancing factor [Alteromonas sediminis]